MNQNAEIYVSKLELHFMKTMKQNFKPMIRLLLIAIILLSAMGHLVSIALGVTIISLSNTITSLTQEQYFYLGLINVFIALTCIRIFDSLNPSRKHGINQLVGLNKPNSFSRLYNWGKQVQLQYVNKNQIPQLKFSNQDVLSKEEAVARDRDLQRAMNLGNSLKHMVKIFFKDQESPKYTETTIWYANNNHIYLKSGFTSKKYI